MLVPQCKHGVLIPGPWGMSLKTCCTTWVWNSYQFVSQNIWIVQLLGWVGQEPCPRDRWKGKNSHRFSLATNEMWWSGQRSLSNGWHQSKDNSDRASVMQHISFWKSVEFMWKEKQTMANIWMKEMWMTSNNNYSWC